MGPSREVAPWIRHRTQPTRVGGRARGQESGLLSRVRLSKEATTTAPQPHHGKIAKRPKVHTINTVLIRPASGPGLKPPVRLHGPTLKPRYPATSWEPGHGDEVLRQALTDRLGVYPGKGYRPDSPEVGVIELTASPIESEEETEEPPVSTRPPGNSDSGKELEDARRELETLLAHLSPDPDEDSPPPTDPSTVPSPGLPPLEIVPPPVSPLPKTPERLPGWESKRALEQEVERLLEKDPQNLLLPDMLQRLRPAGRPATRRHRHQLPCGRWITIPGQKKTSA